MLFPLLEPKTGRSISLFLPLAFILIATMSCNEKVVKDDMAVNDNNEATYDESSAQPRNLSQEFKDYWYAGEAEITSYRLSQARYGELREGTAALIYVTEDFLPKEQVKADQNNKNNIPVLKLNATKNFNTGIYPYSVMTSTFYPVNEKRHAIKVSQSMQEWCGHVYAQLNNRDDFEVMSHSYFQGEADQDFNLPKAVLENEVWTQLRINPQELPVGEFEAIPDLAFVRMKHVTLQAYPAKATRTEGNYTLQFPTLGRTLSITFTPEFPYAITGWEETFKSGFGNNAKQLKTTATAFKTIKSAYWGKNSNADAPLRKELGLE
ncbi:septum formation inhibitor Maf [Dokdonia sinensis]|uniref:Septum formation inhibitor Maf n=1 Tax=Dokdonia sinensis TaxID=2479847 RepID=A0A3M0FU53_9FLAO|nr:septum formation inhibitor Maf [Dokdonia sinensis]RMB56214.1 septum formation inhibitor Maf [Dokdonia sinensis]